jgi:hypothetical protein
LPAPQLAKQQPPDGDSGDEGGQRERTGIHQNTDHDLDRDGRQKHQRGAE